MIIAVGSQNKVKVNAVTEVLALYPLLFPDPEIEGVSVPCSVSEQPLSLEATLSGAKIRAQTAFEQTRDCRYSFGIESGLIPVPYTKTGYMDITGCVIYDGNTFSSGLSSAMEQPIQVTQLVLEKGVDVSEAWRLSGLTTSQKIGAEQGSIYVLTSGRIDRTEYTKQAIMMALIQLEHFEFYKT